MEILKIYTGEVYGVILRKRQTPIGTEFITHEFRADDPENYYWGHYFMDYTVANRDFFKRLLDIAGLTPYDLLDEEKVEY